MMFFPIRKCTFVLRYILLLFLSSLVMFILFQLNVSPKVIDDVIIFNTKELRASQIPPTSSTNLSSVTTTVTVRDLNVPTEKTDDDRDVNHHNFKYLLNPTDLCDSMEIFLVIYVHSAPLNLKKRMSIRETWGYQRILNKFKARIVFVLGKVSDIDMMQAVKMESYQYGDILQEDFIDTYRNLSHKAIGAIKWINHYCRQSKYVLKTDDDIFVHMYRLVDYIHTKLEGSQKEVKNILLCNQWINMKVIRNEKSKWYLSKREFSLDTFPKYCSGSAFLMSNDVVLRMYNATLSTPFFWIDDYYLTGMVFKSLKIEHSRFNEAYSLNGLKAVEKFQNATVSRNFVFYHTSKIRDVYSIWTLLQKERLSVRTS